jgi:hypothetical protein
VGSEVWERNKNPCHTVIPASLISNQINCSIRNIWRNGRLDWQWSLICKMLNLCLLCLFIYIKNVILLVTLPWYICKSSSTLVRNELFFPHDTLVINWQSNKLLELMISNEIYISPTSCKKRQRKLRVTSLSTKKCSLSLSLSLHIVDIRRCILAYFNFE